MLKDVWTVTIFVKQEFVRDFSKALRQRGRKLLGVRARIFAVYCTHRVHVLVDQLRWNARDIGCVLDKSTKTVSRGRHRRITERCGLAFDIVSRVEKCISVGLREILDQGAASLIETTAFGVHPAREFGG